MILDTLDNIETYKNLSQDIYEGLIFVKNVKPNIELGSYEISKNVKLLSVNIKHWPTSNKGMSLTNT